MMADADADFTESYAKTNLPWDQANATERVPEIRRQIVAQVVYLLSIKINGFSKARNKLEDTFQAVHAQVTHIEQARESIQTDIGDFSSEELKEFTESPKMKTFLSGIEALKLLLKLQIKNLEVAEQLDSQYQIDFQALHGDAKELQSKLVQIETSLYGLLNMGQSPSDIRIDFSTDGISLE